MTNQYIPKEGDIIYLDFEPSAGSEIRKRRPALVVSVIGMNKQGFAYVVPITSTAVQPELLNPRIDGAKVKGHLCTTQLRSLDYVARNAEFVETVAKSDLTQVREVLKHLMGIA